MSTNQADLDSKAHWDGVYTRVADNSMSWYCSHLATSLRLIRTSASLDAPILDVGGGHSTLVDDLLELGYRRVAVLDVSPVALSRAKGRLGESAKRVTWLSGDVLTTPILQGSFAVWHDRAVFHFLRNPQQRLEYRRQIERVLQPGGSLILATFGPQGPLKCSGLEVCRYDDHSLATEIGPQFRLIESLIEMHQTPSGGQQQFQYCHFIRE